MRTAELADALVVWRGRGSQTRLQSTPRYLMIQTRRLTILTWLALSLSLRFDARAESMQPAQETRVNSRCPASRTRLRRLRAPAHLAGRDDSVVPPLHLDA